MELINIIAWIWLILVSAMLWSIIYIAPRAIVEFYEIQESPVADLS